jgi:hypothetical protein
VAEDATTGDGVVGAEASSQRFGQGRDLRAQLALRQLGESRSVSFASDQRLDHRPTRLRQYPGSDRGQLDAGVLQDLLQALNLGRARVDLRPAIARQLPQLTDRRRRHKAGPDHPVRSHVSQPLGIAEVALTAGDPPHVARVAQPHDESRLKRIEDGFPVHASGFHRHQLHLSLGQPSLQLGETGGRSGKPFLL